MKIEEIQELAKALAPVLRDMCTAMIKDAKEDVVTQLRSEFRESINAVKESIPVLPEPAMVAPIEPELIARKAIELITIPEPVAGEKGDQGPAGNDGISPSVDDIALHFERRFSDVLLTCERRFTDAIEKAIAAIPIPKDGVNGADGMSLEHFSIEDGDDDRTHILRFSDGKREVVKTLRFSHPLDRGIWNAFPPEGGYLNGDGVSHDGSWFIAQVDNPQGKPAASKDWRLAMKRGPAGASAFQIAKNNGYAGTEKQWLESLYTGKNPIKQVTLPGSAGK